MPRTALLLVAALTACSVSQRQLHSAAGAVPVCAPGVALGRVAVRTELAWRSDQKEPERRAAIADAAIRGALGALPCASAVEVAAPARSPLWSALPEARVLAEIAAGGADTALLIRVHELGPLLEISRLPPHWEGHSEVDLLVRVLDTQTGEVRLDAHQHALRGGPFVLRGASVLEGELREALDLMLAVPAPVRAQSPT
jgi:hypothetical protein